MRCGPWRLMFLLLSGLLVSGCSDHSVGDPDGSSSDQDGSSLDDGGGDSIQRTDGGSFSDEFQECTSVWETATIRPRMVPA